MMPHLSCCLYLMSLISANVVISYMSTGVAESRDKRAVAMLSFSTDFEQDVSRGFNVCNYLTWNTIVLIQLLCYKHFV
jgi:hypothetical protein